MEEYTLDDLVNDENILLSFGSQKEYAQAIKNAKAKQREEVQSLYDKMNEKMENGEIPVYNELGEIIKTVK